MPKPSRLPDLLAFDAAAFAAQPDARWLAGIDEVGRGSCIGPVVAAAVLMPRPLPAPDAMGAQWPDLSALDDSKRLTFAQREALSAALRQGVVWGLAEASPEEIATLNIAQASLLAGYRALCAALASASAHEEDTFVLIDGRMRLPQWPRDSQEAVVKGDGRSFVIAAASVIAKQSRDAWAMAAARDYPHYGWETNMGYPTPAHQAALARYGPSPLHRMGYKPVREAALALEPCFT